ncbi:MAG: hypothetical protein PUP93_33070 [Rhizonema sp. NSF051]|nr:hypothetical protein [Rhizonema sp. NSF051]
MVSQQLGWERSGQKWTTIDKVPDEKRRLERLKMLLLTSLSTTEQIERLAEAFVFRTEAFVRTSQIGCLFLRTEK